jgi:hypothetical protein
MEQCIPLRQAVNSKKKKGLWNRDLIDAMFRDTTGEAAMSSL